MEICVEFKPLLISRAKLIKDTEETSDWIYMEEALVFDESIDLFYYNFAEAIPYYLLGAKHAN